MNNCNHISSQVHKTPQLYPNTHIKNSLKMIIINHGTHSLPDILTQHVTYTAKSREVEAEKKKTFKDAYTASTILILYDARPPQKKENKTLLIPRYDLSGARRKFSRLLRSALSHGHIVDPLTSQNQLK